MDRGQLYGDGFFETMLVDNGHIPLLPLHYSRIISTASRLRIGLPEACSDPELLEQHISHRIKGRSAARLRMNVIRNSGGLYTPQDNRGEMSFILSDYDNPLNKNKTVKENVGVAKSLCIFSGGLSNYKLLARTEQVLLSLERKDKGMDDLVVLNEKGEIVECVSSNIFFIDRDDRHITPPLSCGALDGIMRKWVRDHLISLGCDYVEKIIRLDDLSYYKSVYCTNSLQGIVPIRRIAGNVYPVEEVMELSAVVASKALAL